MSAAGPPGGGQPPEPLGPYRPLEPFAEVPGGLACRAVDGRSGGEVVLKLVPRDRLRAEPDWQLALAEARQLTHLDGSGLQTVYEVHETDEAVMLALEPLGGESLRAYLRGGGAVDRARLADWGGQILTALAMAHSAEVLHRHLGEESIVLAPAGRVALGGFGLSRLGADPTAVEIPAAESGPFYTHRTDLYAVGRLLERLAAHVPGPGGGGLAPGDPLAAVLTRATAADPADRWADAADMEEALRAAAGVEPGTPSVGRPPAAAPEPATAAPEPRRGGAFGLLVALAAIAAGAALGWWLYQRPVTPDGRVLSVAETMGSIGAPPAAGSGDNAATAPAAPARPAAPPPPPALPPPELPHYLVRFDPGSAAVGHERLAGLASFLSELPAGARLLLIGRAAPTGDRPAEPEEAAEPGGAGETADGPETARRLAQRRVETLRAQLAAWDPSGERIEGLALGSGPPRLTGERAAAYGLDPELTDEQRNRSVLVVAYPPAG